MPDFKEEFGKTLDRDFWDTVIDWNDKNVTFGQLIHKVADKLNQTK